MDCVICNTSSVEKVTQLRKDGKVTMIKSAELIGDTNLVDSLKKIWLVWYISLAR